MKIVDLSRPYEVGKMHPNPKNDFEVTRLNIVEKDGMNTARLSFGNHVGTHLDGPGHIIVGGQVLDTMPLEKFYGTGVILDVRTGDNAGITVQQIEKAKPAVKAGDVVLLYTGFGARFGTEDYRENHTYLSPEAAAWLVAHKVRMVGIDTTSVDLPHSMRPKGFRHNTLRILLTAEIPVIHNLDHLEQVLGKRATIAAFPIKFGSDGSPARVVALLD